MYFPNFGTITSGQFVIPGGTKGYNISILSGSGCINGVIIPAPMVFQGGFYDSKEIMRFSDSGIVIGCTGTSASPCRISFNFDN